MNDPRRTSSSAATVFPFLTTCWFVLAVVSGAGAAPAQAASLPSASTNVFCSVEGNSFRHPADCQFGGSSPIPSSAEARASDVPHAFATASTPPAGVLGAGASATVLYFFQVEGPTVGELVPIRMDTYLSAESTFEAKAIARMILSTSAGTFEGFEVCSDGTCEETKLSETIDLQVLTGSTRDSVTLFAQAQAFVTRSSTEVATAVAVPYIYIDPSFPNAHLYSVVVSPGVGNAPLAPVPEPAMAHLLGAGLFWIAWRGHRARRVR